MPERKSSERKPPPPQRAPAHHPAVKHPIVPALPGESVAGEEDPGDFENASLSPDRGREAPDRPSDKACQC